MFITVSLEPPQCLPHSPVPARVGFVCPIPTGPGAVQGLGRPEGPDKQRKAGDGLQTAMGCRLLEVLRALAPGQRST